MQRLTGRVALITGAGQGIGRGIALAMAKEGASVAVVGRTRSKLDAVVQELSELGLTGHAIQCDVGIESDAYAAVDETVATFGTVDILVNAAASGNDPIMIEDTTEEYFLAAVRTNMLGCFHFMKTCLPYLKRGRGSVINFGSGTGLEGWASLMSYAATKEAIRAMSRSAAREWGRFGINVNVLCPAANSPANQNFERENPELFATVIANTPLGYIGDCEQDIGRVAVFLACDESRYITGHTINVDGGLFVLR